MRVQCLAQEHNIMSSARARAWAARSGDEHANHDFTAPSTKVKPMDKQRRIVANPNFLLEDFKLLPF